MGWSEVVIGRVDSVPQVGAARFDAFDVHSAE